MHVISTYQGEKIDCSGVTGHPQNEITINVNPSNKPIVLALTSYEAILWKINVASGANLVKVITIGYYKQQVCGIPSTTVVENICRVSSCDLSGAYRWEPDSSGNSTGYKNLISVLRNRTGLVESSFQGCYSSKKYIVPYVR